MAFTPILWSQALITEVYTLSAVVLLLLIHAGVSFALYPSATRLFAVGYLGGLSLTAHPSLVLAAPGMAWLVLRRRDVREWPVKAAFGATGFFLLGSSLYLYLPLRSLADPVMDWGDPESWNGFLSHVLRRQYVTASQPADRPVLDHTLYLGYVALFEVGCMVSVLACLGFRGILRFPGKGDWPRERGQARRAFRGAYVLWVLAFSVGILLVVSVNFERPTLALNSVFFIPLLLLMAPSAALGIDRLQAALENVGAPPTLRYGASALLPLGLLAWHYRDMDKSEYTIARDYAEGILATLPEGAVYIPSGDHANFPVLYLQVAKKKRQDVIIADKYGYLDPQVIRRICATEDEYREVRDYSQDAKERWLIDRAGRPVFTNAKRSLRETPANSFTPVGLLYRIDRERESLSPEEEGKLWASYEFGNLDDSLRWEKGIRDTSADYILCEVFLHRAEYFLRIGASEKALAVVDAVGSQAHGYKKILNNAGSLLVEHERFEEASRFYEAALQADPEYAPCRRNYAWALLRSDSQLQKAIRVAERSLTELQPEPAFLMDLGEAYIEARRYRNARDAFRAAARTNPRDHRAWKQAGQVAEKHLKDPQLAKLYYKASLKRRPTQPDLIEKVYGEEERERFEKRAKAAVEAMANRVAPLGHDPSAIHGARRQGQGHKN